MPTICAQTATRLRWCSPTTCRSSSKNFAFPQEYEGCHTTIIDGYVIEGHVPATIVRKLLKERPPIRGISLPGMPDGSPGMTGQKTEPFVIYEFGDSGSKVYAQE